MESDRVSAEDEVASTFNASAEEVEKIDKYRMGAAISFAVMLLVIGIPLWWKTTEVHRAALPYSQIEAMDPSSVTIRMKIWVSASSSTRTSNIIMLMKTSLVDHQVLKVDVLPLRTDLDDVTFELLEKDRSRWLPETLGDLVLVEVPSLKACEILFTNDRLVYFTPKADIDVMARVVKEHLLHDHNLVSKVVSIVSPQNLSVKDDTFLNALRASPSYDVVLTVINSDPEHLSIRWDVASDLRRYFQPLLNQVDDISSHGVKSQWLYLLDLGEIPKMDSAGVNVLSFSQLPHIITPLEKRLGSGISKNPCVHLVLYVVDCSQMPLKFLTEPGDYVDSMISPQWGGIQLLNPEPENCENGTVLEPNSKQVIGLFTSQFHSLLGIQQMTEDDGVNVIKRNGPLLRGWELDSLYRTRIVEQITSASLTLQSLSKLLGEIGNIVINEEVASSINLAVDHVFKARKLLDGGKLLEALEFSKSAFIASERAFSDPSLLALLYFPDDQKYAVYIPLFLPIMIPVLMSLKKIYSWMFSKRADPSVKTD
ncbi:hypothetical protein GE061_019030 [Apolygus lucorum]|uniref:GPI transamidase component PIG-S n=1 Tax=Apolygus lucorum TaxID=248454 RepID=A0A8S9X9W9_APOLU|nr:hypothetical protein GE061_019030 [Apolygus lucorum]